MSKGTAILKKFTGKTSKPRTSLAEASPVSPSALPENERERTTSAGYGLSLRGAFAYFDRGTSSWRTPQGCLVWASDTFSETWPPSGMMRNGIVYPRPRLVPRTSVTGYGLWPTPRGADVSGGDRTKWVAEGRWQMGLREAVRMFPTPAAADGERGSETYCRGNPTLLGAARLWPTPNIRDHHAQGAGMNPKARSVALSTLIEKRMWPTPRAQMGSLNQPSADKPHKGGGKPKRLEVEVGRRMWPTPTEADGKGGPGCSGRDGGENLRTATGGQLNPTWVDWYMGYPLGWTDLNV